MMNGKIRRVATALLGASMLAGLLVSGASAHGHQRFHGQLGQANRATERFKDVNAAIAAGYGQPPAPAPLHECISSLDGTGAMGFHFINGSLLDAKVDPRKPEALVYAPDGQGGLRLVALEYVVFQADWEAAHHKKMPKLFHEMFMSTPEPNRFEIPAFFSLHVWMYKDNPSGLFEPFNPDVSCDPGGSAARSDSGTAVSTAALASFSCTIDRRQAGSA
jgi:hypothetical protein